MSVGLKPWLLIAIAALALPRAGCRSAPVRPPDVADVASLAGSPAPHAADESPSPRLASLTAEAAQRLAQEVSPRVESIRGLKFKRPVPVKVVDAATGREHFRVRALKFWPAEQVHLEERAFAQLGLIQPGTDLLASLLDILEEQAAGYYDPEDDTFYVMAEMPAALLPVIMAHELTHALDDQHFGIDALIEKAMKDDDRAQALGAVVEGTGTLVMSVYMIQEIGAGRMQPDVLQELQKTDAGQAAKLRAAGPFMQRSLVASYVLGQTFMLRGNLMGLLTGPDPEDLNRAYRNPPLSTEQILHPEKYWDESRRDEPRTVALGDLSRTLGPGWSLAGSGQLGELTLAVLTGAPTLDLASPTAALAAAWTNAAAAGVGGDLYQHYINQPRQAAPLRESALARRGDSGAGHGPGSSSPRTTSSTAPGRSASPIALARRGDSGAGHGPGSSSPRTTSSTAPGRSASPIALARRGDSGAGHGPGSSSPRTPGSGAVTVLGTLWDTPADAQEFEAGLQPVAGRKSWRRGDAVVLVAGDAGDRAQALADAALAALAHGATRQAGGSGRPTTITSSRARPKNAPWPRSSIR